MVLVLGAMVQYGAMQASTTLTPEEEVAQLQESLSKLYKQMMMNQLYQEENMRATGDSGIEQIRVDKTG